MKKTIYSFNKEITGIWKYIIAIPLILFTLGFVAVVFMFLIPPLLIVILVLGLGILLRKDGKDV